MKKPYHNLKLIIPSKENELFSIKKYKKRSGDIFYNSFFSTQYNPFNTTKNQISFFNNKKYSGISLNETDSFNNIKNKTNYYLAKNNINNTNTNKFDQIPFPSFPNKKQIPALYKTSTKFVKYPKIHKDNFTLYNHNKNTSINNKDNSKFFNTFSGNKINAETQTSLSINNKTYYKEKNHFGNLNISPIKKEPKVKYRYKLYKFEAMEQIKNEFKKKLNINNFDNVLNKIVRLIEMRDEHNKGIKYTEVTNLLLDEIYSLIETKNKEKRNILMRKKYRTISTSISHKFFKGINNKFHINNDEIEFLRKKVRFRTFLPNSDAYQTKYSFDSDEGNKIEDKEFLYFENNQENISKNNMNKTHQNKNENNILDDDESDSPARMMKSKYNIFNLMNEKREGMRKNIDINNYNKSKGNNNLYNINTNYNNNNTFGKTNIFNNFVNQGSKGEKNNKINESNQLNILNLIKDLTSKIDDKTETNKNKNEKERNKEQRNKDQRYKEQKNNKNNKDNSIFQEKNNSKRKEKIQFEKYFKSEKLINLIKQFSKLESVIEENYSDEYSEKDSDDEKEENKDSISNKCDFVTIDDYVTHKNIELGKIKRKKRKAKTYIIKGIDFGIEIIKNICEEVNLFKKDTKDLYNLFMNIKSISAKPEISKNEEKIQKKALKTINAFIKNYLIDMQKLGLTKEKSKFLIRKYFKYNLNAKLNEILNNKLENNILDTSKKSKSSKKKGKNQSKNIHKKKLIFDNSYFFKSSKEKKFNLKDISISQQEESNENSVKDKKKPKSPLNSPKKIKEKKFGRRSTIFKYDKKREGLLYLSPTGKLITSEEEKKIERENLLDRRLKAFFEEIKVLKNINSNNNSDELNSMIDKETEKIDYAQDKKIEERKYNFYEELRIKRKRFYNDKKIFNAKRYLSFQSPVIFNMHKDKM